MKQVKTIVILLFLVAFTTSVYASENDNVKAEKNYSTANQDSINILAQFSLFYEYYKNNDYKSAIPFGWTVINHDPTQFIKYKLFTKMEDILWFMHDSVATSDEQRTKLADTTIYLYDTALKYEPDKKGYYLSKKAYIMEIWLKENPEDILPIYEEAIASDSSLPSFYKDRLGQLYMQEASDDNDYKLKALDLYSALSEAEPENETWIQRIESLAENIDELIDITKRSWDLDKNNLEKAWKYANNCLRAKEYEKAKEPLEFLVDKSPEVINYWKQLASVYDKLNENDKAINAYKKLIDLQPNNRDNYVNIALIYKKIDQLSVARSYLQKASNISPDWDYPYFIEAQLYEQAARNCGFEFMDKCVYQLAVDTYRKAARLGGAYSGASAERVRALANSVPSQEDYFFRNMKNGETIKIEGRCYDWINRSISVP